jgi:tetratricopeptide (TPR) repeat protein
MGQLCFVADDFPQAAADWLSATACFLQATALREAEETFCRVQELQKDGQIPPGRNDLFVALREREAEIAQLRQRLRDFDAWFVAEIEEGPRSREEKLALLQKRVRELPGLERLHAAISDTARELGSDDLAVEHNDWAMRFCVADSEVQELVAWNEGWPLFEAGRTDEARGLAQQFLTKHPESLWMRLLLASTFACPRNGQEPDFAQAIEVLRPAVLSFSGDERVRTVALAFTALFYSLLGHTEDVNRLVQEMNHLETIVSDDWSKSIIAKYRTAITSVGSSPGDRADSLVLPEQQLIEQTIMQMAEVLAPC